MKSFMDKLELGCYPTPLQRIKALEQEFSLSGPFYIKREDLSGLGPGGNKVRCMEYLLHKALQEGCDTVIASGPYESNLCTTVAAACAALSLECVLVYNSAPPEDRRGNMLLNTLLDVREIFTGPCSGRERNQKAADLKDELRQSGKRPFLIENGASTGLGILGYIDMVREIKESLPEEMDRQGKWGHIFVPGGNGGVAAGVICGNYLEQMPFDVTVISVENSREVLEEKIKSLMKEAEVYTGPVDRSLEELCEITDCYSGGGWGENTAQSSEMVRRFPQLTGIFIEHIYCSKTVVGAVAEAGKAEAGKPVIYVHTGGFASLFAQEGVRA